MLKNKLVQFSITLAFALSGITAFSQGISADERTEFNNDENIKVERTDLNGARTEEKNKIGSSEIPVEEGGDKITIKGGEIVHVSLKNAMKFEVLIIDNKSQSFGDADFIAFDEAGEVVTNGSEEFGPATDTALWYNHLLNGAKSAEVSEIYVRLSLKDDQYETSIFDGVTASRDALTSNTTFILPVTRDTGGYRKYDSRAVSGKFHTGDDYYNNDLRVMASNCGVVENRYTNGTGDRGLGNTIIIRHNMADGGTSYSLYAHLSSFATRTEVGRSVSRGQLIGVMGKSGTGSNNIVHLHYEQKRNGILGNPLAFGTYSVNALGLVGYVPQWAGNRSATSATNYGYFKPSTGDYPAICSQ